MATCNKENSLLKIKEYIDKHLSTIYKSKRDCNACLLMYQTAKLNTAYRVQMIQDCIGKVGTYTEALTNKTISSKSYLCTTEE